MLNVDQVIVVKKHQIRTLRMLQPRVGRSNPSQPNLRIYEAQRKTATPSTNVAVLALFCVDQYNFYSVIALGSHRSKCFGQTGAIHAANKNTYQLGILRIFGKHKM